MNGIAWCAVRGANVINLSLGGSLSWSNAHLIPALQDLFEEIVNFDDVLVVASAGNSGVNNLEFPAKEGEEKSKVSIKMDFKNLFIFLIFCFKFS